MNGAPSTHILKPTRAGSLSSLAQNEYICMKLAKQLSLAAPDVDLIKIAGKEVFVIERYDRIKNDETIRRLHQEDFCLLSESLNIKSSVVFSLFNVFAEKMSQAFMAIKNDKKVDTGVASKIYNGIKERLEIILAK